jgi:hypothetical protein
MLVMLPFWTSFLLRVYAWRGLLTEAAGWPTCSSAWGSTRLLAALGLIPAPGKLMHTPFSLVLGMTYTYLPFMILPLYGNLAKMDLRLLEAAADLGATPWVAFWKVTVPLSKAGIIAGSMLVFIPCVGEFVIPELLGGPETLMIGRVLWDEFFSNNDWPMAVDGRGGDGAADHRAAGHLQQVPGRSAGAWRSMRHRRHRQPLVRPRLAVRRATCSCTCRSWRWSSSRSTTRRCPTSGAASR